MESTIVLKVEGMTCGHCAMTVAKALQGVKGVKNAKVDLSTKQALVTLTGDVPLSAMQAAVAEEGYEVVGTEPFKGIELG